MSSGRIVKFPSPRHRRRKTRPARRGAPQNRYRQGSRSRFRKLLDYALIPVLLGLLLLVSAHLEQTGAREARGTAVVHDGDTITLGGERLRLRGIDAPELAQTCVRGGETYACGRHAREALAALTGGQVISCSGWKSDRYGRLLVTCETGRGVVLNRQLVEEGWAVAYGDYEDAQRTAKTGGLGLWAGSFDRPAEWRVQHGGIAESAHDPVVGLWRWLQEVFRLS